MGLLSYLTLQTKLRLKVLINGSDS